MTALKHRELSKAEAIVVRNLCTLGNNKAIALAMDITECTVKVHIRNILRGTGIKSRTLLAVWAVRNGLDK